MATQSQCAADAIFPQEGGRVQNVKFHRGRSRAVAVTAEQLAEQVLSANRQIEDGTATLVDDIDGDLTV